MKRLLIIALLAGMVGTAGAFDIYLLQDTYEQPKTCDCFPCAAYCADPPTFRVFGDLGSARKALRESAPVRAFKLGCWTFSNSTPQCQVSEMEIVTDKDLREKASINTPKTGQILSWDNTRTLTITP